MTRTVAALGRASTNVKVPARRKAASVARMLARSAFLLAVLIGLVAPTAAQAEWDLAPDGHPSITAGWFEPEQVELFVCPPGADACTPVDWTNRDYQPGETAAGTTFEVRRPDGTTERSPAWQGQVRSVSAPTVSGRLFATGDALAHAGAWTGGWGDDMSWLSLYACGTAAGAECLPLPQIAGCPVPCETVKPQTSVSYGGLAGIPAAFAGRYLFATETRIPRDQRGRPIAVPALWSPDWPSDLPPAGGLVSVSGPVGPLGLPSKVVEPVSAPTVTLRTRALRSKGRLSIGRITCVQRCKVSLKVSGGRRKAKTSTFTVTGTRALRIAPRRGKLTVRVHVDGKLLTRGRVTAR
jgi:hypothetical protein